MNPDEEDRQTTTCTFCDNVISYAMGRMPETPVCTPECKKRYENRVKEAISKK